MHDWQLAYLGRHTFPTELTNFELRQTFTFDAVEREDIRKAFRSRLRIGAAPQLGFLRLTGTTLSSIEYVPAAVLRHLGSQFAVPTPDLATLRALYKRKMTRVAHQSWAIEYGGFRVLDTRGEELLIAFVRERTHGSIARPRLEQYARAWLHRNSYLMPPDRWLSDHVRSVIRAVTTEDHAALVQALSADPLQACLERLLERRPTQIMTHLEWVRLRSRRRSFRQQYGAVRAESCVL
jgi:Domain of unknown function (DUF4158)